MAAFQVRCVEAGTGRQYMASIEAETFDEAVGRAAAAGHTPVNSGLSLNPQITGLSDDSQEVDSVPSPMPVLPPVRLRDVIRRIILIAMILTACVLLWRCASGK